MVDDRCPDRLFVLGTLVSVSLSVAHLIRPRNLFATAALVGGNLKRHSCTLGKLWLGILR